MGEAAEVTPGRLAARPRPPPAAGEAPRPLPAGLHPLGLGTPRDGLLRVPAAPGAGPLPLIVMLHGAGSDAARALRRIEPIADAALVLAPESLGATWDVIERRAYGPDAARLDAALARVFADWPVDPARVAVAGFSDGASYALSLALMNGDLFTHALGFSPGFAAPDAVVGKARIFISHGTADAVLPVARCGRRLAAMFERNGWPTRYVEFAGGHVLPEEVAREALAFFLDDAPPAG